MTGPIAEALPHPQARVTGVVYLLYFVTAFAGLFLLRGLVVHGDPVATAHNLLANEPRFRLGFAAGLLSNACYVALTALLYELLAPVSRKLSLLAAFFSLMGCAIQTFGSVFELAPLVALRGTEPSQRLALMLFDLYAQAVSVALVFFAVYCLGIGYLIVRSAFLPRALGVLLMVAGCGWLTFLWPPLAQSLSPAVQGFGFLAELALMLWLLARGVDVRRWREQAGAVAI
jgi:hypothetical protein